jgi:lipoprotein-anchoring transpeptidase ErfK/SrfK
VSVRPRYGRIAAFSASVAVTLVAVLGASGILPAGGQPSHAATRGADQPVATLAGSPVGLRPQSGDQSGDQPGDQPGKQSDHSGDGETSRNDRATGRRAEAAAGTGVSQVPGGRAESGALPATPPPPVPADSGEGRRVVFDQSAQRVWLVAADGSVRRTYPVSGSRYDNLDLGTYAVYSRSEQAYGYEDSGTMRYMVRFAHGANAAIGFHDIPVKDGEPVQTEAELGTALSIGCIRQATPDAKAMWRFADLGTTVVVTE